MGRMKNIAELEGRICQQIRKITDHPRYSPDVGNTELNTLRWVLDLIHHAPGK